MKFSKRVQKGFSLIEIMLVLGLTAVFIGIVFMMYQKVQSSSQVNTETQNLTTIQAGVHSLYASQSSFAGLTTTIVIAAHIPPDTTVSSGAITNSWGGVVTTVPNTNPVMFDIKTTAVPQVECSTLSSEIAANFRKVVIGGTTVKDMTVPALAIADIGAITTACSAGGVNNTIVFTSM